MSNRGRKPSKGRAVHVSENENIRARKEVKFQLHDEADLVNFRADALNRYITNQDLLDNVTSKLIHTAHIVPPSVFLQPPIEPEYGENPTETQLMDYVKSLKVGEMFSVNIDLMKAKLKVSAQELEEAKAELDSLASLEILNEEARFQSKAVEALSQAQANCTDEETLKLLETQLHSTIQQYQNQFKKRFMVDARDVRKHSIPIQTLAPGVNVDLAPRDYNARVVPPFGRVPNSVGAHAHSRGNAGPNVEAMQMLRNSQRPGGVAMNMNSNGAMDESRFTAANEFSAIPGDYADIAQPGHDLGDGTTTNAAFDPNLSQDVLPGDQRIPEDQPDAYMGHGQHEPSSQAPQADPPNPMANLDNIDNMDNMENMDNIANDMDMDELDQFLADPNDDMAGIDELINFDQTTDTSEAIPYGQMNEQGAPAMDDDPFSVDFLSQMGTGM